MIRALAVVVILEAVLACRPSAPEAPAAEDPAPAPAPDPDPAAVPASAPASPTPAAAPPVPRPDEPQAGGRPLSWWGERLTALRKDGPPELYELAQQRARANGLRVQVGVTAVTVEAAAEPRGEAP